MDQKICKDYFDLYYLTYIHISISSTLPGQNNIFFLLHSRRSCALKLGSYLTAIYLHFLLQTLYQEPSYHLCFSGTLNTVCKAQFCWLKDQHCHCGWEKKLPYIKNKVASRTYCLFEESIDMNQKRGVKHHSLFQKKYILKVYFKSFCQKGKH